MALFEILTYMADHEMDITRLDTVHSADLINKGAACKLSMVGPSKIIHQLGAISGKQTHIPIMFVINAEQYDKVEKLLAQKEKQENG